ncbi:MAG: hypothetical protein KC609_00190 [Myxococcales bacterium]|nr:hypothetical protein [Myxococcales bacterium]
MAPRLSLVILAVDDLEQAAAFYEPLLEWRRDVDVAVYREYRSADGFRLGLYQRDGFARNTTRRPEPLVAPAISATELYFFDGDPAAACEKALSLGAELLSPLAERPWGDRAVYVRAPEGTVLVFAAKRDGG